MNQKNVYIVVEWQERGTMTIDGDRLLKRGRAVFTAGDYPEHLPCHNPECEGGGFDIGARVLALLNSGQHSEQNSLICTNAVLNNRDKRCLHTIFYSIARVLPYGETLSVSLLDHNIG